MKIEKLVEGAYDLHIHAAPDVVPRAQTLPELAKATVRVGMAGLLIKDHTASTAGRCLAMNEMLNGSVHFVSSLSLNPPIGGLNPCAVEAALREGTDVIYFPTYGAKNHIAIWGAGKPPTAFPLPGPGYAGLSLFDGNAKTQEETEAILRLIARYDAVMATGHISPVESLALIKLAVDFGVKRTLVTHVSESVTDMSLDQQKEAIQSGAFLEHCFFAVTGSCPGSIPLDSICEQIRLMGVDHIILSSDLGQVSNGPPVEGFCFYLEKMMSMGFSDEELRVMIHDNPRKLLKGLSL
jgi:hypothetical protein